MEIVWNGEPVIVDVAANKDNICLEFLRITVEKEALEKLKWIASMIEKQREETPQTIGHFRVPKNLTFKTRLSAKPLL